MVSAAGGTVSGNISFTNTTVVQTPTANNHAANKSYVDTQDSVINTELGTNPSGTFSTVKDRLDSYTTGFNTVGNLLTLNQAKPTTTGAYLLNALTEGAAGVFTTTATSGSNAYLPSPINVTAGDTYTAVSTLAPVGRSAAVFVEWLNGSNAIISSLLGNVITAGTTGESRVSSVAPAGAVKARLYAFGTWSGAGGDTVTVTKVGLWKGAGGTWALPGTPITGQSRIAVNNAVDLSGTGVPNGVLSAAPGSSFLQIGDAVTVSGNLLWRKATGTGNTGWVPEGALADTGWRDVSADLLNSWASVTPPLLRRVGNRVDLNVRFRLDTSGASADKFYALPSGFRPTSAGESVLGFFNAGFATAATGFTPVYYTLSDYTVCSISRDIRTSGYLTWVTDDAWPSSNPGSAA